MIVTAAHLLALLICLCCQECKVQNMIREYCKIFAAEARIIENFGCSLEYVPNVLYSGYDNWHCFLWSTHYFFGVSQRVIPQYLMYRPANSVPYATVEAELKGAFLSYCMMDAKGKLITRTTSEVEQKCSTFQHWIHQWTHGNLLVTRLDGKTHTKLVAIFLSIYIINNLPPLSRYWNEDYKCQSCDQV